MIVLDVYGCMSRLVGGGETEKGMITRTRERKRCRMIAWRFGQDKGNDSLLVEGQDGKDAGAPIHPLHRVCQAVGRIESTTFRLLSLSLLYLYLSQFCFSLTFSPR
jgi:hypothetical protein